MEPHVNSPRYWTWISPRRPFPLLRRNVKDRLSANGSSSRHSMEELRSEQVSPKRRRLNPEDDNSGDFAQRVLPQRPRVDSEGDISYKCLNVGFGEIIGPSLSPEKAFQLSRVRCTISLFSPKRIPTRNGYTTQFVQVAVFNELGTLQTSVDMLGKSTTQVLLSRSFDIPLRQIGVNSPVPTSEHSEDVSNFQDLDNGFGIAQTYALQIRLERLGNYPWPPPQLSDLIREDGEISKMLANGLGSIQDIELFAKGDDLHPPQTGQQKFRIGLLLGQERELTNYHLIVHIRWPFPISPQMEHPEDEDPHDELTVINYTFTDEIPRNAKVVNGFRCYFCLEHLRSQPALLFHLTSWHPSWGYSMEKSGQLAHTYNVTVTKISRSSPNFASRDAIIQLGPPTEPFELERYLDGDRSWILSRRGISDQSGLASPSQSSIAPSIEESTRRSPISSQNTDVDMEDPSSSLLPKRSRQKVLVPKTEQPLYDILTKRILRPGEEFSDSEEDSVVNALSRKHADVINDFSDVTDDEKDYIIEWDKFMRRQNITANCYFAAALSKFLDENGAWVRQKESRSKQFGLHLTKLCIDGTITARDMAQCTRKLREVQKEQGDPAI